MVEAQEITIFLKAMKDTLMELENAEFDICQQQISATFHVISLMWANCVYYQTPARIIVFLQELANMMIQMARKFIDYSEIFKGEVEETIPKVKRCYSTLEFFLSEFNVYKRKIATYFTDKFAPTLVFARYERFANRIKTAIDILETAIDFFRLEKVEVGGSKGQALSLKLMEIHKDFNERFKVFTEINYDFLDPEDKEFMAEAESFDEYIKHLDFQIAAILRQALDDCSSIEASVKFIELFSTIVERRPRISADLEPRYVILLEAYSTELDTARKAIMEQNRKLSNNQKALVHNNMAPVSGVVKWAKEWRNRITTPLTFIETYDHP